MDIQSGYFTAPTSGYYYFSFSGTAYDVDQNNFVDIAAWKNSGSGSASKLAIFTDMNSVKGDLRTYQHRNLAGTWIAQLQEGDTVNLNVQDGYLTPFMGISFTGQLLLKSQ